MAKSKKAPELTFQEHIANFLTREHKYGVLEQTDITDTEHFVAEDHLWAFLKATQDDRLKKLTDDYGTDARDEIFRALRKELEHTPLWMILRNRLKVRGLEFHLFYPKPRSSESAAVKKHGENRITFRPHFYFGETNQEIDFVLFLNGLPIVVLEVKHEKNQNVHDAVAQCAARNHARKIFQHPFLYLAADTSDVMAASDPRRVENFRWHNSGLTNTSQTAGEYPVEFLYREVLSKDELLEALSFFLVRVPKREAEEDKPERQAFTILPRYHQSRMVRKVADDALEHFVETGDIGRKYLVDHSAGSGKTLSICWLADRLHSLFKPDTNEKLVDIVFILTDRKSLDTNIREDIEKFAHLKDVVGLAKKSEDLPRFLKEHKPIIVATLQKFAWVLEEIEKNPELKNLRVAFLIDEAHRSQEGQMGAAIRVPFRKSEEPDTEDAAEDDQDEEERIARIIHEHDRNQLFVAFTATPAPATVTLFGAPFDSYTEAEAIAEGYIVDVAASIISYKTLYNLNCPIVPKPDEEKLYPKGIVSKALQNVAYQDDGLIQYKAEVMLRIFDKDVKPLVGGRAKAMIVATSRVAGIRYFKIIKEKLRERNADYKVLFAFSDFVHPETNESISEHAVNELKAGELIEDRFEGDDYRLMIVANKFQTGFDQPLLAGMFLDKPVIDRNAVQTVSRLNRSYEGKKDVVVVDFTNNARAILKAFAKYRKGTPFKPDEPDPELCTRLHADILEAGIFTQNDARDFVKLSATGTDAQVQFNVNGFRVRFQAKLASLEDRKTFVYLLARFVKSFHFLTCFFTYPPEIKEFATFAEYVGPQLIKAGSVSELMKQIRQTEVIKAAVEFQGVERSGGPVKLKLGTGKKGSGPPPKKVSVQDMISEIRAKFDISDEEALYIKQVTEEKVADPTIRSTVHAHREDLVYLEGAYRGQVNGEIQDTYSDLGRYEELADIKYTDTGGIFDLMAVTVIQNHLATAA
jgi:type I restriction enzyme R subunit